MAVLSHHSTNKKNINQQETGTYVHNSKKKEKKKTFKTTRAVYSFCLLSFRALHFANNKFPYFFAVVPLGAAINKGMAKQKCNDPIRSFGTSSYDLNLYTKKEKNPPTHPASACSLYLSCSCASTQNNKQNNDNKRPTRG